MPAYSTLGWFDDPVLNTVIRYPDAEIARLIFHGLANSHTQYVDTVNAINHRGQLSVFFLF